MGERTIVSMTTYAPPSPDFIGARFFGPSQTPRGIVIHATVTPDNPGTARRTALWWHGPTSPKTSAHYVVDPKEAIQCVRDHSVAYHCGYNSGTIAVELCDEQVGPATRWNDADSQAILRRAARLVAELALAYDIDVHRPTVGDLKLKGPHGIYGHNDSRLAFGNTTHSDPRDFDWDGFLKLVRQEVTQVKAERAGVKFAHQVKNNSRVAQFKQGGPSYDLNLLDDAIKNGRTGVVKLVRDDIDAAMKRVALVQPSKETTAAVRAWQDRRILRLGLLTTAVRKGRLGTVRRARDDIRAAIARLDLVS